MKKYISKIIVMALLALSFTAAANAQFAIRIRPATPVINIRPVCPSPRHIWVNGEYVWRGGNYVYTDGYWAEPHAGYRGWVEGHWKSTRRGWVWVPGHWRR